jgi:hypothetical protein
MADVLLGMHFTDEKVEKPIYIFSVLCQSFAVILEMIRGIQIVNLFREGKNELSAWLV